LFFAIIACILYGRKGVFSVLDKSVPYYDVVMCLPDGAELPAVPALPEGYAYTLYAPGKDERFGVSCWHSHTF